MFRTTTASLFKPLYHREAIPLGKGIRWHGNWGGAGNKFYGKASQHEAVTPTRSVVAIDRDMVMYAHRLRIRHRQMRRIYSEKAPTMQRNFERKEVHLRAWLRKLQLSYRAYAQFATMRVLKDQAQLVNKYGQAAVNRALGDYVGSAAGGAAKAVEEEEARGRLLTAVHRAVRTPPAARPVKRHVVTRFQKHNDRFDLRWRQGQK